MVKLRALLTIILKAEARDYGKGHFISDAACGVWPITMHWVSWPSEQTVLVKMRGFVENEAFERGGA